jgi:hypothetical protein
MSPELRVAQPVMGFRMRKEMPTPMAIPTPTATRIPPIISPPDGPISDCGFAGCGNKSNSRFVGNTEVSRRYFRIAGNKTRTLSFQDLGECVGDFALTIRAN